MRTLVRHLALVFLSVLALGQPALAQFLPPPQFGRPGSFFSNQKPKEISFFSNLDIRTVAKDGDVYTMIGVADEVMDLFAPAPPAGVPDRNVARWSPDGERLLYADTLFGIHALVSVDPLGNDFRVHLFHNRVRTFIFFNNPLHNAADFFFQNADWSPDGRFLIFNTGVGYVNRTPATLQRLFAYDLFNNTLFQITDDYPGPPFPLPDNADVPRFDHLQPRWSWSQNKLLFVNRQIGTNDLFNQILACDPDGDNRQLLLDNFFNNDFDLMVDHVDNYSSVSWSHGGDPFSGSTKIAFTSFGELVVADVNLNSPNPMLGGVVYSRIDPVLQPAWSPDDSEVVLRKLTIDSDYITRFHLTTKAEVPIARTPWPITVLTNCDWRPRIISRPSPPSHGFP